MSRFGTAFILAVVSLFSPVFVHAGNVNGTVQRNKKDAKADKQNADKQTIVVWIEGAEESRKAAPLLGVSLSNQQFVPDFLVLARGQHLQLSNDDTVQHNLNLSTGADPISLKPHEKHEMQPSTFTPMGLLELSCSIHTSMVGRIFVVPTGYYAVTKVGGKFTIPNVPPGTYVMKVWDEPTGVSPQSITVPQFGAVNVDIVLPSIKLFSDAR